MIDIKNITKSFGSLQVLKGIDLHIDKGEVVSIVGPSGAGKTTLLQIIGTLDKPDTGSVHVDSVDVTTLSQKALADFRNKHLGFVFQFHQLLPEFTAIENIMIPAYIAGTSHKAAKERATELLQFLGLSDRANHKPNELSGGEKQRVAVARALINSPAVILADEPSGSLDSKNKEELHQLFFDLRDKYGQTFVIVTHDETLATITDRTIHMKDGLLEMQAPLTAPEGASIDDVTNVAPTGAEGGGYMIKLGDYNTLKAIRRAEQGLYLEGDEASGDILLPNRYVPDGLPIGKEIEVFVYLDQEERLIATTEKPLAKVGEFASLEVAWINKYGAFLKWGLMKDLFCPFREQKQRMEVGKHYIVYVKEDEETHRLMATAKVERYIENLKLKIEDSDTQEKSIKNDFQSSIFNLQSYKHGEPCDCLIWQKTDLGFKTIVNNRYQGQIYDNQIFQPLHSGDRLTAYIDHVRQDGKIDLTLQPTGRQHTLDFAEVLLRYLYENDGHCDLGDKSPAELIYDRFKVSKKAYKKAIGDLYRRRLIVIEEEGIRLA